MPIIEFICPDCGYQTEELVKADGNYPPCPKCGKIMNQKYHGKLTVNYKAGSGCSGDCGHCGGGCHHD